MPHHEKKLRFSPQTKTYKNSREYSSKNRKIVNKHNVKDRLGRKTREIVEKYPSIKEAARQTGIDSRYISPVYDKEGRSAKGYIWRKYLPSN
jgi:hypothetical protein